jgi:hypothetical protein
MHPKRFLFLGLLFIVFSFVLYFCSGVGESSDVNDDSLFYIVPNKDDIKEG